MSVVLKGLTLREIFENSLFKARTIWKYFQISRVLNCSSFDTITSLKYKWESYKRGEICFAVHGKNNDKLACHQPITTELSQSHIISVENRMNASAFRDIWAGVIFFKFSKLHEPHEMHERSYDFSFLIF